MNHEPQPQTNHRIDMIEWDRITTSLKRRSPIHGEDVSQDLWVKARTGKFDRFDDRSLPLVVWRTASNDLASAHRKSARTQSLAPNFEDNWAGDSSNDTSFEDILAARCDIEKVLKDVPAETVAMLGDLIDDEAGLTEIAEANGLSRDRAYRLRKKLRDLLRGHDPRRPKRGAGETSPDVRDLQERSRTSGEQR